MDDRKRNQTIRVGAMHCALGLACVAIFLNDERCLKIQVRLNVGTQSMPTLPMPALSWAANTQPSLLLI